MSNITFDKSCKKIKTFVIKNKMRWILVLLLIFGGVSSVLSNACTKKETTKFCLKTFKDSWKICVKNIDTITGCYNGFCANLEKCKEIEAKVRKPKKFIPSYSNINYSKFLTQCITSIGHAIWYFDLFVKVCDVFQTMRCFLKQ